MTRDEYVEKLKTQLDQWNLQSKEWEAKARDAQGAAQAEIRKRLDELAGQREQVMYQMKLLQNASVDAWSDMMRGADDALRSMREAFEKASGHFTKK
jgi:hypothetical protein